MDSFPCPRKGKLIFLSYSLKFRKSAVDIVRKQVSRTLWKAFTKIREGLWSRKVSYESEFIHGLHKHRSEPNGVELGLQNIIICFCLCLYF